MSQFRPFIDNPRAARRRGRRNTNQGGRNESQTRRDVRNLAQRAGGQENLPPDLAADAALVEQRREEEEERSAREQRAEDALIGTPNNRTRQQRENVASRGRQGLALDATRFSPQEREQLRDAGFQLDFSGFGTNGEGRNIPADAQRAFSEAGVRPSQGGDGGFTTQPSRQPLSEQPTGPSQAQQDVARQIAERDPSIDDPGQVTQQDIFDFREQQRQSERESRLDELQTRFEEQTTAQLQQTAQGQGLASTLADRVLRDRQQQRRREQLALQQQQLAAQGDRPQGGGASRRIEQANSAVGENLETLLTGDEAISEDKFVKGARTFLESGGQQVPEGLTTEQENALRSAARSISSIQREFGNRGLQELPLPAQKVVAGQQRRQQGQRDGQGGQDGQGSPVDPSGAPNVNPDNLNQSTDPAGQDDRDAPPRGRAAIPDSAFTSTENEPQEISGAGELKANSQTTKRLQRVMQAASQAGEAGGVFGSFEVINDNGKGVIRQNIGGEQGGVLESFRETTGEEFVFYRVFKDPNSGRLRVNLEQSTINAINDFIAGATLDTVNTLTSAIGLGPIAENNTEQLQRKLERRMEAFLNNNADKLRARPSQGAGNAVADR